VVDDALCRDGGADTFVDRPDNLEHSLPVADPGRDHVPRAHRRRSLRTRTVHLDVPRAAQPRR
jgi:hypothetical protein